MKKKPTTIVFLALFALSNMVMGQHQDKAISQGCMSLKVPSGFKIEKSSGSIGSNLQIISKDAMYMFFEMNSDFDAEYVMHSSILNNLALSEAKWDDVKD